jgi:hypothetical protein
MYSLKNRLNFLKLFFVVWLIFLFACDKNDDDVEVSNVYSGNVYITNQTELEEFASYAYKKIEGHIKITGVSSLVSLQELEEVFTLEIFETQLDNLQGLNNLRTFTGEDVLNEEIKDSQIIIRDNKRLSSLEGLASAIFIDHLTIRNNVNLFNFCALKDVEVLGLYNIQENWLNPTIAEIKDSNTCLKEVYINPNCNEPSIRKVYLGDVDITNQQQLIEFGNQEYTEVEGALTISGVNNLVAIERIRLIEKLVIKNTELKNLDDLKCLAILNELHLFDNPLLDNLKGLSNTKISQPIINFNGGEIEFENESGVLTISNNDALVNLEGLEKIEYLKTVLIENNDNLLSLKALSNLVAISDPGRDSEYPNEDFLKIINNDGLLTLEGLENMSVLHLYVHDNDALQDLKGLSKISRLEVLSIKGNKNITTLNGLNGLSAIKDYHDVYTNPGYTLVLDNIKLTDFCVLKDVDFVYYYPDNYQVSGNAYNPTLAQVKSADECSN